MCCHSAGNMTFREKAKYLAENMSPFFHALSLVLFSFTKNAVLSLVL